MCWRALAPTDALPKDYHDRHVNQWSGDGGFIISYYVRQGKFINFVCVRQQPGWTEQSWSVPSNVEEMLAAFPHAGEKLRRMMAEATSCSKWGQFTGEHAPQWTKDRVTLLGDSAHAMLATFGQGANMAFEDAYVLSRWLRAKADDPAAALAGYEAARKPRATKVQQLSRTEVRFKKQHSSWDRLRRQATFIKRARYDDGRRLSLYLQLRPGRRSGRAQSSAAAAYSVVAACDAEHLGKSGEVDALLLDRGGELGGRARYHGLTGGGQPLHDSWIGKHGLHVGGNTSRAALTACRAYQTSRPARRASAPEDLLASPFACRARCGWLASRHREKLDASGLQPAPARWHRPTGR